MLNANGPGFRNLYSGDSVQFRGPGTESTLRTARVLPLLVFEDHVQVDYGACGYTVNAYNFVRLVRRGKRHIAADRAEAHRETWSRAFGPHDPRARGAR
jgi:hypothetical protein